MKSGGEEGVTTDLLAHSLMSTRCLGLVFQYHAHLLSLTLQICYNTCAQETKGFEYFGTQYEFEVRSILPALGGLSKPEHSSRRLAGSVVFVGHFASRQHTPCLLHSHVLKQCWCAESLADVTYGHDGCNAACKGNSDEICGGLWRCGMRYYTAVLGFTV